MPQPLQGVAALRINPDFYGFVREMYSCVPLNIAFHDTWEAELVCDEIQSLFTETIEIGHCPRDLVIKYRPEHTQITASLLGMCLPWIWTWSGEFRGVFNSAFSMMAAYYGKVTRNVLESDVYKHKYCDLLTDVEIRSKTYYHNNKKGLMYGTETGGVLGGIHADIIVCNDPFDVTPSPGAATQWYDLLSCRQSNRRFTPIIAAATHSTSDEFLAIVRESRPSRFIDLINGSYNG